MEKRRTFEIQFCSSCGNRIESDSENCSYCGRTNVKSWPKDETIIFCGRCKWDIPVSASYCPFCGNKTRRGGVWLEGYANNLRSSIEGGETEVLCGGCMRFIKASYNYCPYCGKKSGIYQNSKMQEDPVFPNPEYNRAIDNIDKVTLNYLEKIGRIDEATKLFDVRIAVPWARRPITIRLLGANNSNNALHLIYKMEEVRRDPALSLRFTDWPSANPIFRPDYHHVSACVCELPDRVYHVEEYAHRPFALLYGCPNIRVLDNQIPEKAVEVIDYD